MAGLIILNRLADTLAGDEGPETVGNISCSRIVMEPFDEEIPPVYK